MRRSSIQLTGSRSLYWGESRTDSVLIPSLLAHKSFKLESNSLCGCQAYHGTSRPTEIGQAFLTTFNSITYLRWIVMRTDRRCYISLYPWVIFTW
ncbi:hypothetical protein CGMCC3_g11630 [Colletotrichum fructicola]|nr:uncharacterized protein CGMCC3_g11630 [Colletotrichum fructicola]KAE9572297.1 hypothetical protein CGMCC3_g11630 [Colletotrichum fructicola]